MKKNKYYLTDFHTHTIFSKDCLTKPKKLIKACNANKLTALSSQTTIPLPAQPKPKNLIPSGLSSVRKS